MILNRLGNSDLLITRIGLGTWAIGGGSWEWGWGPQDDLESIGTILKALESGINWIDTAPVYGLGHSEEIVCAALKKFKGKVIIATKFGNIWEKGEQKVFGCLKAKSIKEKINESLQRLNLEVIDLYQLHWPQPDEDLEESWWTVSDLIRAGKVRYAGVCNCNIQQLKRIQPIHQVASLQNPYSMLNRDIEKELLSYCSANHIGVLAYSPLQTGLLTGKYSVKKIQEMPEADWRKIRSPYFQEPALSANLKLVEQLKLIAERKMISLSQLAIAWVLRRPEVTAAIVGSRHPSQIREAIVEDALVLSADEIIEIDKLLIEHDEALA